MVLRLLLSLVTPLVFLLQCTQHSDAKALYQTLYFNQTVDHFNFASSRLFAQRYLLSTQYWDRLPTRPILFYAGNEGDVTSFWDNSGFITDTLAQQFRAIVLFAEHRYYGDSLPFGDDSFSLSNIGYLTAEQALADYTVLAQQIKSTLDIPAAPVIAVGGSYGGMLAAWWRIKYPHVVSAALASSAPIWMFPGYVDEFSFSKIVTDDFSSVSSSCSSTIRAGFDSVIQLASSGSKGYANLTSTFNLCAPLTDSPDPLINFLFYGYTQEAMVNYPYPTNFLAPLPAWPVKVSCVNLQNTLDQGGSLIAAMKAAVDVYYNYTGTNSCYDLSLYATTSLNRLHYQLGEAAWDYQACTEMILPMSSNGVTDMFLPVNFSIGAVADYCGPTWAVQPRPDWIPTEFGINITASSQIVFSNGQLDPWRSGGISSSLSPSLPYIYIEDGAHHLDLRAPNAADPPSVVSARAQETAYLSQWLNL